MSPLTLLIGGGVLAVILLIVGIVVSVSSERSLVEERLGHYLEADEAPDLDDIKKEGALTNWLNRRMEGSSWGDRVAQSLARADLKLRPGEYLALLVISAMGVGFIAWFLFHRSVIFGILGALLGLNLPRIYVGRLQGQRLNRFSDQLADMLNLVVNGLRAGYSTMQAMEAVSKEMPAPISSEFRRVVQEMQIGIPMEQALDNLYRRIPSDDLDLIITAINVQREVGGNLAEILETIAFTIRERVRIKGEIRVLTAQVMYSGRALAFLPIALTLLLYAINPDYIGQFFLPENRVCGFIAIGVAATMIGVGYMMMNKLADIEI